MKLIVGLGNPGRIYTQTRHNIGFSVVKALGRIYKIPFRKNNNTFSLTAKGKIEGGPVLLALPLTYMNLSGNAVKELLKKYKAGLGDLLVVCDDIDLRLGGLRIRPSGSSGGHRGLSSVIGALGSEEFSRLRIGIGRPQENGFDTADYVLSAFTKKEKNKIKEILENACECCRIWVAKGVTVSMNIFNRRREI